MPSGLIYYVYPLWHTVSFTLVGRRHVAVLRKYFDVYEIDERAIPGLRPKTNPVLILHPFFYPCCSYGKHIERLRQSVRCIIGIDVADTDRISKLAVSMCSYADAVCVPSEWSRQAFLRSGVTVPVYVVHHAVDNMYYTRPAHKQHFADLWKLKQEKKLIFMLHFCIHSDYRKGMDLVIEFYRRVKKEYRNVVLVAKRTIPNDNVGHKLRSMGAVLVTGWLTEDQKLELYDLCDIYLGFSRGGSFELNFLEALVRGEIVLAADRGPWTEYLPNFTLVPSRKVPRIFPDNPVHVGGGYEVLLDKAMDKLHDILQNLDDYKARIREWVEKKVKPVYRWEVVGRKLANIIRKHSAK